MNINPVGILNAKPITISAKRKALELSLVGLVEHYQREGLDISYIGIDLSHGKVDARVTLNETTNIQEQATDTQPATQDT